MLLLNRAAIRRFDYHWLWGLRYHQEAKPQNMEFYLDHLSSAQTFLLEEQQRVMAQRHPVIRFFYYLFNVNQFAFNSYKLVLRNAYKSFPQSPQKDGDIPMYQEKSDSRSSFKNGMKSAGLKIFNVFFKCGGDAQAFSEDSEETAHSSEPENPKVIVVNQSMQLALEQLGIKKNTTETISFLEIKCAFRKRALQAHPDKGGSEEAFILVKNAFEELECLFFPEHSQRNEEWNFWKEYADDGLNELRERNIRLDKGLRELSKMNDEINRKYDEIDRIYNGTDRIYEETDRIHDETDRIHDETDRIHDETARIYNETDRIHDETDRKHDQIDEMLDRFQKLNEENRRLIQKMQSNKISRLEGIYRLPCLLPDAFFKVPLQIRQNTLHALHELSQKKAGTQELARIASSTYSTTTGGNLSM